MSVLGHVVHAPGSYLHFHEDIASELYGDVQGLVTAALGFGYPVPQPGCVRLVFIGDHGVHLPAQLLLFLPVYALVGLYDDAHGQQVHHFLEWDILLLHLFPYRPGGLGALLVSDLDA